MVAAAAPTTTAARPSAGSTSRPPGRTRRSRPASRACPGRGSSTPRPRSAALLRSTPAAQLGDRFPGHQIGTIGAAALPAPNSLIIVVGHTAGQLARAPGAAEVTQHPDDPAQQLQRRSAPSASASTPPASTSILSVVARGAAVPGADLHRHRDPAVGRAPRAAVRRHAPGRRHAPAGLGDLRRRGGRRRRRRRGRRASACSSCSARRSRRCPFTGAPFFPSDLSLSLPDILLVAIGVPVAAAVAARLALRRVQISPLGVSRRVTPRRPAGLAADPAAGRPRRARLLRRPPGIADHTGGQIQALHARLPADHGRTGHRRAVADHGRRAAHGPARPAGPPRSSPRGGSPTTRGPGSARSAGSILALFVTTVAVGVITTIVANRGAPSGGPGGQRHPDRPVRLGQAERSASGQGSAAGPDPGRAAGEAALHPGRPGRGRDPHRPPAASDPAAKLGLPSFGNMPAGLVSCAQLARTPLSAAARPGLRPRRSRRYRFPRASTTPGPTARLARRRHLPQRLQRLPVQAIVVSTNGSSAGDRAGPHRAGIRLPLPGPPRATRSTSSLRTTSRPTLACEQLGRSGDPRQPAHRRAAPWR